MSEIRNLAILLTSLEKYEWDEEEFQSLRSFWEQYEDNSIYAASKRRPGYPHDCLIDDSATFKPAAIKALKKYRQGKPFHKSGETFDEWTNRRFELMKTLVKELSRAYGIPEVTLEKENILQGASSTGQGTGLHSSYYRRGEHKIMMVGSLSILTLLHEFGHARGFDEFGAQHFAVNLHRKVFKDLWDAGKLQSVPNSHVVVWRG